MVTWYPASVQSLLFTAEHLFIQTFWQTVNREWPDIDGLRLDKYHMVRAEPQPLYSGLGAGGSWRTVPGLVGAVHGKATSGAHWKMRSEPSVLFGHP